MTRLTCGLALLMTLGLSPAVATPKAGQCSLRRPIVESSMSMPSDIRSAAPAGGARRASCAAGKTLTVAMTDGCEQGCEDEHNRCLDACGDYPNCQHRCDLDFYKCMRGCNCPTSYETEDSSVDSRTYLGDVCGYDTWNPDQNWYGAYDVRIKHQRKRVTRNCDGSTSEEVLDTWYTTSRCYQRGPWSCTGRADNLSNMCLI